jgi:23S rRNA (cytidine1920-2'-O)/16S rRNA (cytidine1409-2'-O)-methyltransferase
LTESRQQARALVDAGRVLVGGAPATKAARLVAPDEPLRILGPPAQYVSRGGDKLAGALARFAVDVGGTRCLDAGASTGGFTDALLQVGAGSVVAVDVGRHQLHERLRTDPRVDSREQTDIRTVGPDDVGGPMDLVVADLSFIAIRSVIDFLVALLRPGGDLIVLVKPQFEAGRAEASRGRGVIRDPEVWRRVLHDNVVVVQGAGAVIMEAMVSPLRGADGNAEFLLHARRSPTADTALSRTDALVERLVAEASDGRGT